MKNPIQNEEDLTRVKIAFSVVKELENWDEITAGNKNNFTVVRNYLANAIANYITA